MSNLAYLDFFAGAGLVRMALEPSWVCLWSNDIDAKKERVYRANFEDSGTSSENIFVRDDIRNVAASTLPVPVQMAWSSFPCQDLSLAGWRRGMSADRSGTFWAFWQIMRDLLDAGQRPPIIVVENVTGLLYGDGFRGLCEALAALGMQFGAIVIDAQWFLPQSRPRVFVVAVDSGLDVGAIVDPLPDRRPWYPQAVHSAHRLLDSDLKALWRWWKLPYPMPRSVRLDEVIEDDPAGIDWHSEAETKHLLSLMSPTNLSKIERAVQRPGQSVGFLYRRTRMGGQRAEVRFDGIAGCLRTPSGGSSRQTVVMVEEGNVRTRLLTAREAARLMGVPDTFHLPTNYNDAYRAMGDGVAVPAVAWLSDQLLVPLADCASELTESPFSSTAHNISKFRESTESVAASWILSRT